MCRYLALVLGASLIWGCIRADDIPTEKENESLPDICKSFGQEFCTVPCKVSSVTNDTFTCDCNNTEHYYDAAEQICLPKRSCKTVNCPIGNCVSSTNGQVYCSCENRRGLTMTCKVQPNFKVECEKKGGRAVIPEDWRKGAQCDCGEWAAMDGTKKKCMPTTCLHPNVSCQDLCEKGLLDKDRRCCQGWNSSDCSKIPQNVTYCSPGSLQEDGGQCTDACTLHDAKLLCPNGCRKTGNPEKVYECSCGPGKTISEDGITCQDVRKQRACNEEERKTCRTDETTCVVVEGETKCSCGEHEHVVEGVCTGKCGPNDCHEKFLNCHVYHGAQECRCPLNHKMEGVPGRGCELSQYYYTVSFTPNITLETKDCSTYHDRVKAAMRTSLGRRIYAVEIINCTNNIKARLITKDPLESPLLKKLQTCEHPEGKNVCLFYPGLPIIKGSATEIMEENLCEDLLKEQELAYGGQNECVKEGNLFWFKCTAGYKEVRQDTLGRLRRSVCEPDPDAPAQPHQNPCLTDAAEICGEAQCEPNADNTAFTCKCDAEFFFDATEKRCYNLNSCKVNKCERGVCEDQNGTFPRTCQCNDSSDLTINCRVKDEVSERCARDKKIPQINPDNSVTCVCPPYTELIEGACQPMACLNPLLNCEDVCRLNGSQKDSRCCQNWDPEDCKTPPADSSFCRPGFVVNETAKTCTHFCDTAHARDVCPHGCAQLSTEKADYKCHCGAEEQLAQDGVHCVEKSTCSDEEITPCEKQNKTCVFRDKKASCECPDNTLDIGDGCSETCTAEKLSECSSIFGRCEIKNHQEQCTCAEPLRWHEDKEKCILENMYKYVVSFRLTNETARTDTYSVEDCSDKNSIMEEAMRIAYGADFLGVQVLECSDEYKVELNFAREPAQALLNKIRTCEYSQGENDCFFPPALHVLNGSVSEVTEQDLCATYLTQYLKELAAPYYCQKVDKKRYALKCSEKYRAVTSFKEGMLDIDMCAEEKCEVYCKGPERQCTEGKCVCHVNYFENSEGVCVPYCSKKPCKNGGVCETGVKTSFYCNCAPYFTGPTCEIPFKEYSGAQTKLTIVGVVLGVLLIICIGTAAVIIRKIQNKISQSEDL